MKGVVRISRSFSLLVLLVLLAALGGARIASASSEGEASTAPFEPPIELSEEAEWIEECVEEGPEEEGEEADEGDEGEGEEEEECEAEAEGSGSFSPDDCLLRTVNARAVAFPERNRVRLTLGYTTYEPARATVEYRARNGNRLGAVSRALGRSGVVRVSKHLGDGEMSRLRASRRFTVTVHVPEAPQRCERLETQQLAVRQSSDSRITWSQDG
jgi:hypothetical protein